MGKENNLILPHEILLQNFAGELSKGVELIGTIEDNIYRQTADGTSGIGGHFRHNLDFTGAFLNGIKTGKIDYNRRERDIRVEENRFYAIKRFESVIAEIRHLPANILDGAVSIRSELDLTIWHVSNAMRELEFLHSHTVHHHALIVEKLKLFGVNAPENFGVAPSTLEFWGQFKEAV